jgi:hypothetical protein
VCIAICNVLTNHENSQRPGNEEKNWNINLTNEHSWIRVGQTWFPDYSSAEPCICMPKY